VSQLAEGNSRSRAHESDTTLEEDLLDDLGHLKGICWEIQERLDVRETVVSEKRVDTEVTCIVGHFVNWT
jgi:hypothetical protein